MNRKKRRRIRRIKWEQRMTVARTCENWRLRDELLHAEQECRELRDANVNLVIERDAADGLVQKMQESVAL